MLYIKNRLSDYENHVADYYLRRGAYVAALNRAKAALEQYNGASGNARVAAELWRQPTKTSA